MRPPQVLASLLLVCTFGCASAPIELDDYSGVYSTHFGGIPDQSRVCAVIVNRKEHSVDWVSLRLRSYSRSSSRPSRWLTAWVYQGELRPGESVAVELPDPPIADEIALVVHRSGRGASLPAGRVVGAAASCSQTGLTAALQRESAERGAVDARVRRMSRRGEPAASGTVIALDD